MKKKSILLAGVLCLAVIAGGCGKKTPDFGYDVDTYVTLGEYNGIEYTPESTEVTDEDINSRIQSDLDEKSTTEQITDRAVQDGDTVNIDYKGLKDGVAFEGGTDEGYELVIGSDTFIDGFEDQLIGAKIGEKKNIDVTFPKEYQVADLAGQPVVFEVKINSITVKKVPELTDENVKEISDYDTIDEYKKAVKDELTTENKDAAVETDRNTIWSTVIANAKIKDYPKEELDEAIAQFKKSYEDYATSMGATLKDMLDSFGMTEEQFNEEINTYGKQAVADKLVFQAISLKEKITLTDKEYEEQLPQYVKDYNLTSTDELIEQYGEDVIKDNMLRDKVLDYVVSKAVVAK